jgi:serine/threonine protein kinase/TPR repeat protein
VTVENWERVKELLDQVIALAPEQRSRFLDEACASDSALRAELESLLSYGEDLNSDFLRSPLTGELDQNVRRIEAAGSLTSGQVFEQRFQLIRKLGEGGMGQVWLAEQLSPMRRPVALKLIKAGMYDEAVAQRFQSERQSLAIMDHPAIAKVFDAGTTPQGQPYLVMEYVPGLPITEYCDQHKLPIKNRLELFIQACEGVQHAHQKAVIHRDLKPANILVVDVDGKAVPRIIDFGLARASTPKLVDQTLLTRFGQLMGTPGYMSPEQLDPNVRDIDTRTDVYSLGVILYVLLTGLQPFETKRRQKPALDELLRQLREEDPPTPIAKVSAHRETSTASATARGTEPKQLARQLWGDLDWVTMKALERDRERRYATPLELGADLRRHLQDEPVVARPASAVYQIRKYIRRHRVAAAAVGTVTLLAIVASGAAVIAIRKQHQAEREQLRAEFQQHQADYQAMQALQAQSRLLTLTAAQRLRDADVTGAQGIILEVLRHPAFAKARTMAANSVFQDIRAADALFAVLSGHDDIVTSAAFSPDGTRIVTASRDQTARVWSAQTGAELGVLRGHSDTVQSAAYSPDGTRIVTASGDKTARIWDAQLGVQLAVLSGHSASIRSAAYSPDGTRIITASHDKTARIWDARTGAQLAVLEGHLDRVESAAYSPDGRRIVTASADKTARIWDARTGARIAVLAGHGYSVWSAAFSPDGTRVLSASNDTTARVWDVRTGRQLLLLSGHGDAVRSAAYSFDGTRIVTASDDKTARVWDARVPANIATQILWDAAAETDPLPDVDRTQLGLLPDERVRKWSTHGSTCDQAAAAFYDPDRLTAGVAQATIVADVASSACSQAANSGNSPRLAYQKGRALLAGQDAQGAKRQFELAVSKGYRVARVDLANLLVDSSAGMLDPNRAALLYEQAWQGGVPVAAFALGQLYENGVRGPEAASTVVRPTNVSKAWFWYQKGADAGEPNALARFAERDESNAIAEADAQKRDALLLQAFSYYSAATERAHDEDWPQDAWRHWRYRRATLARLLAREGLMPQVAHAYQAQHDKWSPQARTIWQGIATRLNL